MNLSKAFIARPVMTTVLVVALVTMGVFAYVHLPVSELPNVDFPTISVTASLPGANPKNIASAIATPAGTALRQHIGPYIDEFNGSARQRHYHPAV